uniref:Ribonuclease H-like domain-containing protein n=1 Tax=Tanacetum cinerariifolium TaxID=118510 RepID=A0A699H7S9_TANCI|nr:ribonuclease H-like domain-containing protein [Tanacetum cinerariifolium]
MTWNKAYLADYQEIPDGGFVAFGSSRGKIKDPLGKFKGKADEGFLVGYSITSKAFRVFNFKTRKVKENLHVRFLENKPNVAGTGPKWIFDIDYLTYSMNYIPVSAGNQTDKNAGPQDTNGNAGTQDNVDARKKVSDQHYIVLPLCSSISSTYKSSDDKPADDKPKDDIGSKTVKEPVNKDDQAYKDEIDRLMSQEKEARDAVDAIRKYNPINAASTSGIFSAGGPSSPYPDAFIPANTLLHVDQDDSQIPDLEGTTELQSTGIFNSAYDDDLDKFDSPIQSVGIEADFNNMESSTIMEPKKVYQALDDESWVEAMQEELLDSPFDLEAYSDSDYAEANLDRKSITRGCQFLGTRLISWQCKKQTIVATSTTEAEYISAALCYGQTEENAEFYQIVDFLSTCSINYALNVSPTIYASYIEQFWNTTISKTVNSVKQIHAIVDGKVVVISESSVRSDLLFNDKDDVACLTNAEFLKSLRHTVRSEEDRMEQETDLMDFVPPTPYDSPLSGGHTPRSDEDCLRFSDQKVAKESEKKQRARTLGMKLFKIEELGLSDKGSGETKVFDYTTAAEKDVNAAEPVSTAGDVVNAASVIPDVSAAGPSTSVVGPSTSTAEEIFEDEMTTMADTLMAIRRKRPRTTSLLIHDVEEEPRRATLSPTV